MELGAFGSGRHFLTHSGPFDLREICFEDEQFLDMPIECEENHRECFRNTDTNKAKRVRVASAVNLATGFTPVTQYLRTAE